MSIKRLGPLIVAGAIAVAAVGCGSGSGASGDTTASLTPAQFAKQADEICNRGFAKVVNHGPATPQEGLRLLYASFRDQIDQLGHLAAPHSEEKQVEEFLAAMDHSVTAAEEGHLNLTESKNAGPQLWSKFTRTHLLGLQLGFTSCAY